MKKKASSKKKKAKPLTDGDVKDFFDNLAREHNANEAEKLDKEILDVSEDEYKKLRKADKKKRLQAVPVNVKKIVKEAVDKVEPKVISEKPKLRNIIVSGWFGNLAEQVGTGKTRIKFFMGTWTVEFNYWIFFWKSYPELFNSEQEAKDFIKDCEIRYKMATQFDALK